LLEAIERLVELTDIAGVSGILKTSRLCSKNSFRQGPVKEGVLYIELVNWPATGEGEGEHCPNCGGLDNRAECLVKVDPRALSKASEDPTSLAL
jgi:hypothetical protein